MRVGNDMMVKESRPGALAGSYGVIVEIEQVPHGSLMVRCRIAKDDTDATLWWLSRDEIDVLDS